MKCWSLRSPVSSHLAYCFLLTHAPVFLDRSAGIGFAPNGMRTMDLIEPGFRPLYEKACVGNLGDDAQHIFFEGMLMAEGFGMCALSLVYVYMYTLNTYTLATFLIILC